MQIPGGTAPPSGGRCLRRMARELFVNEFGRTAIRRASWQFPGTLSKLVLFVPLMRE